MSSNPFSNAQERFRTLQQQFYGGQITQAQFEAALRTLMVQDAQGRWWMIGAKTGQWHVHDGDRWMPAQPPIPVAPVKPIWLPEQSTPATPAQPVSFPPPVTRRVPDVPRIAQSRKRNSLPLVLGGVVLVLGLVLIGVLSLSNFLQPKTTVIIAPYGTPTPGALVTSPAGTVPSSGTPAPVLAQSTPQPLLSRVQYLSNNDSLAVAIANLNRAELKFIQDVNASLSMNAPARTVGLAAPAPYALSVPLIDTDLREMAASGMSVGNLASDLGRTAGAYDHASDTAGQVAGQYHGIARMGYAIVIESQNMRDELNAGKADLRNWANKIADYGIRLWNPAVSGGPAGQAPVNPFLAYHPQPATVPTSKFLDSKGVAAVKAQFDSGFSISSWVASAPGNIDRSIPLPASNKQVANRYDPDLAQNLTTAAGQSDPDTARQVAAARISQVTQAELTAAMLKLALPEGVTMVDSQLASQSLPGYKDGTAAALAKPDTGDGPFVETFLTPGDSTPMMQARVPVDVKPEYSVQLVLTLNHIAKTDPESGRPYTAYVTLSWNAPGLVKPDFQVVCNGSTIDISTNSGQKAIIEQEEPGDNNIICDASSPTGRKLGAARLEFDAGPEVGSAADKTAEAQRQQTEWASRDAEQFAQETATAAQQLTAIAKQTAQAATAIAGKATSDAVAKEVAGTQTAEFRATITQIARMTAQAQKAGTAASVKATQDAIAGNVFTMNGTFNLTWGGSTYVGLIKWLVNANPGQTSTAHLEANRNWTYQDSCDPSITWKGHSDFGSDLSGTVISPTGELTGYAGHFSGTTYNSGDCGKPGQTMPLGTEIELKGVIDLKNHTGKGQIVCNNNVCAGDWHAGQ